MSLPSGESRVLIHREGLVGILSRRFGKVPVWPRNLMDSIVARHESGKRVPSGFGFRVDLSVVIPIDVGRKCGCKQAVHWQLIGNEGTVDGGKNDGHHDVGMCPDMELGGGWCVPCSKRCSAAVEVN